MATTIPLVFMAASAFLLQDPWRQTGLSVSTLALVACGLIDIRAGIRSLQALEQEHAAGYTTLFGGGYRYWQLEAKTGTVLRRPGERTVHREGIPRELLAAEAAARAGSGAETDPDPAKE